MTATENRAHARGRHREIQFPSLFLLSIKGTSVVSCLVTVGCNCSIPSQSKSLELPPALLISSLACFVLVKEERLCLPQ